MESALDTLRTALADGATAEQRAAGITTCRAMLAALEASPGQPLPVAPPAATPSSGMPTSLAGLTLDQVLDLAIGKMRSMLPPDKLAATQPNQPPLAIQLFRGTS